jgi:hypothetical protein
MLLSRLFGRQSVPSTRRSRPCRKPLVESLEGRQLLSAFVDTPMIQGNHIGTSVVERKHVSADSIQGNHIGAPAIVGIHIG